MEDFASTFNPDGSAMPCETSNIWPLTMPGYDQGTEVGISFSGPNSDNRNVQPWYLSFDSIDPAEIAIPGLETNGPEQLHDGSHRAIVDFTATQGQAVDFALPPRPAFNLESGSRLKQSPRQPGADNTFVGHNAIRRRITRARRPDDIPKQMLQLQRAVNQNHTLTTATKAQSLELLALLGCLLNSPPSSSRPTATRSLSETESISAATTLNSSYQTQTTTSWTRQNPSSSTPISSPASTRDSRPNRWNCTLYQCTHHDCALEDRQFRTKSEWKRHEESDQHWPQKRFMCLECIGPSTVIDGLILCDFCPARFEDLEHVKTHCLSCNGAQEDGSTFPRRDRFRNHLRDEHKIEDVDERQAQWTYSLKSDWPRECGFCGCPLTDWEERANHLEGHFKNGMDISGWKIPFRQRSHDVKPAGFGPNETEDDDQDDFYRSKDASKYPLVPNFAGLTSQVSSQSSGGPSFQNHTQPCHQDNIDHGNALSPESATFEQWTQPPNQCTQHLCLGKNIENGCDCASEMASSARITTRNNTCKPKPEEYGLVHCLGDRDPAIMDEIFHQPTLKGAVRKKFRTGGGGIRSAAAPPRRRYGNSNVPYNQELKILRRLQEFPHGHIFRLVDYFANKNKVSIVLIPAMRGDLGGFLTGFERYDWTNSSPRAFMLSQWVRCLASALEFLHSHHIIHNDIKPTNILIHGRNILIAGFGNAWLEEDGPISYNDYTYTPKYCAPEVAARGEIGQAADIFSLGCVYTEMATVLSERSLQQLEDSFADEPESRAFHWHLISIRNWLQTLQKQKLLMKWFRDVDLSIITGMLGDIPGQRPTARGLVSHFAPTSCCNNCNVTRQSRPESSPTAPSIRTSPGANRIAVRNPRTHHEFQSALDNLPKGPSPLEIYETNPHEFITFCISQNALSVSPTKGKLSSKAKGLPRSLRSNTSLALIAGAGDLKSLRQNGNPATKKPRPSDSCSYTSKTKSSLISGSRSKSILSAHETASSVSSISSKGSTMTWKNGQSTFDDSKTFLLPNYVPSVTDTVNSGYNLHCEFFFIGCELQFHTSERESWIQHSLTHFGKHGPPSNLRCAFDCGTTYSLEPCGNRYANWRRRMNHIATHFDQGISTDKLDPDFAIIMYLHENGLMSTKDYMHSMMYKRIFDDCDAAQI